MKRIVRAGITVAAFAALAGAVWLALRPHADRPAAEQASPPAPAAGESPAPPAPAESAPLPESSLPLRVFDRETGAAIDG
ncbi:MAG: hypothetical protein JXP34_04685, partial [Planctomycetes bacterium]|nr:hypothetical protein [Planctomycetota bacterium]